MYIITVIPLTRGVMSEQLSYFSTKKVPVGTLADVPIRKKEVKSLVIQCDHAKDLKTNLRSSEFALKKIGTVHTENFLSESFIQAARDTATDHATSVGSVISQLIPKCIIDEYTHTKPPTTPTVKIQKTPHDNLQSELFVFQADDEERFSTYKSIIREAFARRTSVFFCLPTIQDIEYVYSSLERGIDAYTYTLHSKLSKNKIIERWTAIKQEAHPVLIIATPGFFALDRDDIKTVIVDNESGSAYKMFRRPFIDFRVFAKHLAKRSTKKLIMGDMLLRTETLHAKDQGLFEELAPLKFRALGTSSQHVIDMRQKSDPDKAPTTIKPKFSIFSDQVQKLIEKSHRNNEQLFLYTARRGLNPITACSDCGHVVSCEFCSAPISLHIKNNLGEEITDSSIQEKNIFLCHKCGTRRSALESCTACSSWNLVPLGIGSQLIEEKIAERYPEIPLFRIDADTASTQKRGADIYEKFLSTPGAILVGTEKALPNIHKKIDNIAVISIDSLFSLPDFRINERIFTLLLRLHMKASAEFYIQTRNADAKIFEYVTKGNILDFYRHELAERKDLGYPPFKRFIKISLEGHKANVTGHMHTLEHDLAKYESLVFPAFIQQIKGKYRMHALVKTSADAPIDPELLHLLQSLPPQYSVDIEPENLL